MPKTRLLVDEGSPLFNLVMRNATVLSPKLQAWVEPSMREMSMKTMAGEQAPEEDGGEREGGAASAGGAAGGAAAPGGAAKKEQAGEGAIQTFKQKCEAHVDVELEARLVVLQAAGSGELIRRDVTNSRLLTNLTAGALSMGVYDVKNARLVEPGKSGFR